MAQSKSKDNKLASSMFGIELGNAKVNQALEAPGFLEFLAKFPGAENRDMESADEEWVLERYEYFNALPKLTADYTTTLKAQIEKRSPGVTLTDAELKPIGVFLEKLLVEEKFDEFKSLKKQVEGRGELAAKVAAKEMALMAMKPKAELLQDMENAEQKLEIKQSKVEEIEQRRVKLWDTEQVVKLAKDIEPLTKEFATFGEDEREEVVVAISNLIERWEGYNQKLIDLSSKYSDLGLSFLNLNPVFNQLKARFEVLSGGVKKKDKKAVRLFDAEDWKASAEVFLAEKKSDIYLAKGILEREVGVASEDIEFLEMLESTESELTNKEKATLKALDVALKARYDLWSVGKSAQSLVKEPWNEVKISSLSDMLDELEVSSHKGAKQQAQKIRTVLNKIADVYDEGNLVGDEESLNQAKFSSRGLLGKVFMFATDPLGKNGLKLFYAKLREGAAASKVKGVGEQMKMREELEGEKIQLEAERNAMEQEIFGTHDEVKQLFILANQKINAKLSALTEADTSLTKFFEAEALFSRVTQMREADETGVDYGDEEFIAGQNRSGFKDRLSEIVVARVIREVKKSLENLPTDKLTLSGVYKKVLDIQASLGEVGKNKQFQEIKIKALVKASQEAGLPLPKRIALKRILVQLKSSPEYSGFLQLATA